MIFVVLCTGLLGSVHLDSLWYSEEKAEARVTAGSGQEGTCWVEAKTPRDQTTCSNCYSTVGGR